MISCFKCTRSLDFLLERYKGSTLPRDTECPKCRTDVRCCMNCRFYSPGSKWDCRETISDPVYDKERRNFCDSFDFRIQGKTLDTSSKDKNAREAFNNLFQSSNDDE